MAKQRNEYKCKECGKTSGRELPFCNGCKNYNTYELVVDAQTTSGLVGTKTKGETVASTPAKNIHDIEVESHKHKSTGIGEFDRVLGGGLVAGGVILLAGPPGVGKALCVNTPILTISHQGKLWKTMGELAVGDRVFSEMGTPIKVVAVTEQWTERPSYKLTFSDGSTIVADENHEWLTTPSYGVSSEDKVMTTKEIVNTLALGHKVINTLPLHGLAESENVDEVKINRLSARVSYLINADTDLVFHEPRITLAPLLDDSIASRVLFIKRVLKMEELDSELNFSVSNTKTAEEIKIILHSLGYQVQKYSQNNAVRLVASMEARRIIAAEATTANTVCIEVDNDSHLFLAGESLIPTHNSSILATVSSILSSEQPVLYVSGEESVQQIKLRHERMKALGKNLYVVNEPNLSKVIWHIDEVKPNLLIVDSLQTLASPDIDGRVGSISQVVEVANIITTIAKQRGIPTIFVGHYTKDGNVAGPRVVEHLVDVVLSFEGSEDSPLRMLRGIKNRFGPADEIGCFEHTEEGLAEVIDPSGLLMDDHNESIQGVAKSIYVDGNRAFPIEIQSLVVSSPLPNPRKVTTGIDSGRTLQLLAILQKHAGVRLSDKDVYVSTVGNTKVKDAGVDLATAFALVSDATGLRTRNDAICLGEVALSGRVRKTLGISKRLSEAVKLGIKFAYVPEGTKESISKNIREKIVLIELKNVRQIKTVLESVEAAIDTGHLQ